MRLPESSSPKLLESENKWNWRQKRRSNWTARNSNSKSNCSLRRWMMLWSSRKKLREPKSRLIVNSTNKRLSSNSKSSTWLKRTNLKMRRKSSWSKSWRTWNLRVTIASVKLKRSTSKRSEICRLRTKTCKSRSTSWKHRQRKKSRNHSSTGKNGKIWSKTFLNAVQNWKQIMKSLAPLSRH